MSELNYLKGIFSSIYSIYNMADVGKDFVHTLITVNLSSTW
jgi:hypothetical protein